jgi:hypothetical protein
MYPRYTGLDTGVTVNQAHNDWAQWAAEGGLPFLLVMIFFAGLLCKPAFRSIYGMCVAAVLLHALVDYPMQQRPALAAWWFAMAGAAWARGAVALDRFGENWPEMRCKPGTAIGTATGFRAPFAGNLVTVPEFATRDTLREFGVSKTVKYPWSGGERRV